MFGAKSSLLVGTVAFAAVLAVPYNALYAQQRGLEFDGVDDSVALGTNAQVSAASLGLPVRDITAEAWVRVDAFKQWRNIIGFIYDSGATEHGWALGYDDQRHFNFAVAGGGNGLTYLNSGAKFSTGVWHHVCGTYDGTTMRLYVDGLLRNSSTAQSGDISYMNTWYRIGQYKDNDESYLMDGVVDEVRVWNTARSAEEVADDMFRTMSGSETNLFGLYACDETNGLVLADSAGTNNGVLLNMAATSAWVRSYAVYEESIPTNYHYYIDGVWKASQKANRGSGMVISATVAGNSDAIVYGCNGVTNTLVTNDLPVGTGVTSRWTRIWYTEKQGTIAPTFSADFGDAGMGEPGTSADYVLLYRAGTSGVFQVLSSGDSIFNDQVQFSTVTDADFSNGYYTVGYVTNPPPQVLEVGSGHPYATIASALTDANPGDTIEVFGTLTELGIVIDKDINIYGSETNQAIVQASSDGSVAGDRVILIKKGRKVGMRRLTVRYGYAINAIQGCGICNRGTLTISDCVIVSNRLAGTPPKDYGGGGLHNESGAYCDMSRCEIAYNTVINDGAGINNKGTLVITDSSIHDNSGNISDSATDPDGGGIDTAGGTLTAERCTIYNNSAKWGGAIYGGATLTACTLHGNLAGKRGGALTAWDNYTINGCTITGNSSPDTGGINMKKGTCSLRNSIVAENTDSNGGD